MSSINYKFIHKRKIHQYNFIYKFLFMYVMYIEKKNRININSLLKFWNYFSHKNMKK